MNEAIQEAEPGVRGPAEHAIRARILKVAFQRFARDGYGQTSVADLAERSGISKAYIYKFFDSKQAIGEVICARTLAKVERDVRAAVDARKTAADRLRALLLTQVQLSMELFFEERRLYEIAACSYTERWRSCTAHVERMADLLGTILREGRASGEFERKTPLDEVRTSVLLALQPFLNPLLLQHHLDLVPDGCNDVIRLVLRSLAP